MFDCSSEIAKFHDERVTLPEDIRKKLRGHRKANQDRLKSRLEEGSKPLPFDFIQQGSYAMHTMNQQAKNDYDIDDGALFRREDLQTMSSCEAKEMVCEALQDDRFEKKPKIHTNCVRVYYAEGHHVDIPVYRTIENGNGYQLASSDWKQSDPQGVTNWFKNSCQAKSDGGTQMRQLVRLLKYFAKSRESWNLPSGLVFSVLVNECYSSVRTSLAETLYDVMYNIKQRLEYDKSIRHPVVNESLSDKCQPAIIELIERLKSALEDLQVLRTSDCNKAKALKAWGKVFATDYFDATINEELERAAVKNFYVATRTPDAPVDKSGGGRVG